jgi:hypothetical protein
MSPEDHRVAALAAVFAPDVAPDLLARLGEEGAGEAARAARSLAASARRDRLLALSAALARQRAPESVEALARAERPRVAAALRAAASADRPAAPVLRRLASERLAALDR